MTYTISADTAANAKTPLASPAKVLKKVTDEKRSGQITIEDPSDSSIVWRVYFGGGQVHFAQCLKGQAERLKYLMDQKFPQMEFTDLGTMRSDYDWICDRWKSHRVPLNIIRQIIATITQEALIHILAMPQAKIDFSSSVGLDPLLLSVPFRQLLVPLRDKINQWMSLQNSVPSPLCRFTVKNPSILDQWVLEAPSETIAADILVQQLAQGWCLYAIANRLGVEAAEVALLLEPLVVNDVIQRIPFETVEEKVRPLIACVDDSRTIQQFVKLALEPAGYDVMSLLDPTEALQHLLSRQPLLILMDIEMPKMDGYELCRMVRQIEALRKTPVVMLTGREGLIDRVRAKMLGTSAYLTKPFNPPEMLKLVQKLTPTAKMTLA